MDTTPVGEAKRRKLKARMDELGILEDDLVEKFVQGSGSGGQKINKTSSCVFLSYPTAGIEVKCQRSRSLALNRHYARWELCERIAEIREGEISRRQKELVDGLRSMLGLAAKVTLVAPKSIVRSEGKAVRVIDKRKI